MYYVSDFLKFLNLLNFLKSFEFFSKSIKCYCVFGFILAFAKCYFIIQFKII